MKITTYKMWHTITRLIIFALVVISVVLGNWIMALISAIAGMIILIILRVKVKGIVEDERTYAVTRKAAYFTFSLGTFITFIAGMVLVFTNRDNLGSREAVIGYTLFFTSFAMYILSDIAYYYNSRKLGGKNE